MFLRKAAAFIKKEFLIKVSYRFAFLLQIFSIVSRLLIFYFIDRLFGSNIVSQLKPYGVNYFPYVFLGLAFFTYVGTGLGSFANRIRNEQLMGTLEALLATPTKISTMVISIGLWSFIWASISVLVYLICGAFLFGVDLTRTNLLSALVILLLTITSFSGLGLSAASFIMILKRGEPFTWLVNTLFGLFGGVYFPISILPGWIRIISYLLPVTYAVKTMQLAVYRGYPLSALTGEITALLIFSAISLPSGLLLFKGAVKWAKRAGNLAHY